MKKFILLTICTFLFAEPMLIDGLERANSKYKRDACKMAKSKAKRNFNVKDMNVGCSCEIFDSRDWMCYVHFKYQPTSIPYQL